MDHARGRITGSACWGRSEGTLNSYKVRADLIVDSQLDSLSMHIHLEEGGGGVRDKGQGGDHLFPPPTHTHTHTHTHTTHQCCLSSNPIISKLCGENKFIISIGGLNLLLFLVLASGGFSLRTSVLPSPQNRHFLTQNRSEHARTFLIAFFGAPRCFVGKQISLTAYMFWTESLFLGYSRSRSYWRFFLQSGSVRRCWKLTYIGWLKPNIFIGYHSLFESLIVPWTG